jgi:hypothetical protein
MVGVEGGFRLIVEAAPDRAAPDAVDPPTNDPMAGFGLDGAIGVHCGTIYVVDRLKQDHVRPESKRPIARIIGIAVPYFGDRNVQNRNYSRSCLPDSRASE